MKKSFRSYLAYSHRHTDMLPWRFRVLCPYRDFFRYRVVFCFAVTYRAYHRGCIRFQAF